MIGKYISCSEIGGDFYDCIQIDDKLWFIIADVSGHGVAAAMISSMLKVMFTSCANLYDSPARVLECMNDTFYPIISGRYHLTAFVGLIKDGTLTYANAGHPYPVHINSNGEDVTMLEKNGLILGAFDEVSFTDDIRQIEHEDIIFCYTDGLLESQFNAKVRQSFTCEDIYNFIAHNRYDAIRDIKNFMDATIKLFGKVDARLIRDDIAIMNIKVKNPG